MAIRAWFAPKPTEPRRLWNELGGMPKSIRLELIDSGPTQARVKVTIVPAGGGSQSAPLWEFKPVTLRSPKQRGTRAKYQHVEINLDATVELEG